MSVCAKVNSYCVQNVLSIAKAYMSYGILKGAVAHAALVAGVFMVSILQEVNWTRVSTAARQYFSMSYK